MSVTNNYVTGTLTTLDGLLFPVSTLGTGLNMVVDGYGNITTSMTGLGQGAAGPQGSQGVIGLTGHQGAQGVAGVAGAQGAQGVAGSVGSQGSQGVAGVAGAQGAQGVGSAGPTGPTGSAGSLSLGVNVNATPDSATITTGVLALAKSSSAYRGVLYGYSNNTAHSDTAVGYGANPSPGNNSNVSVGYNALNASAGSDQHCIAIGDSALVACTGTKSIGIGTNAGSGIVASGDCIAIGYDTQGGNSTDYNIAVGSSCLKVVTGSANIGAGRSCMTAVTGGFNNCAYGDAAGNSLTTGANNAVYGANAGQTYNYSRSIYVGSYATPSGNVSNEYVFGYNITGSGSSTYTFDISSIPVVTNVAATINTTTGQLTRISSSKKYKTELPVLDMLVNMSAQLAALQPKSYYFNADKHQKRCMGYYAEDLDAVKGADGESVWAPVLNYTIVEGQPVVDGIDYSALVIPLIEEIKALRMELKSMKFRIESLETRSASSV